MDKPWILFESGALAKGLSSARVCTLLVDLKPSDLDDPLAQFNHTLPEKEGIRSLVGTLNGCLGASALPPVILEHVFTTYWEQFQNRFQKALKIEPSEKLPQPKSEQDLLVEILDNTRSLQSCVRRLEGSLEQRPDERKQSERPDVMSGGLVQILQESVQPGVPHSESLAALIKQGLPESVASDLLTKWQRVQSSRTKVSDNHP